MWLGKKKPDDFLFHFSYMYQGTYTDVWPPPIPSYGPGGVGATAQGSTPTHYSKGRGGRQVSGALKARHIDVMRTPHADA